MPTSSQAMILRGSEAAQHQIKILRNTPLVGYQDASTNTSPIDTGELVKFDFSVSAAQDYSLDKFEGIFEFDNKTNSHHWKIASVFPKRSCDLVGHDYNSNDFAEELNGNEIYFEHGDQKQNDLDSYRNGQSPEYTYHNTTPETSSLCNSYAVNQKEDFFGKRPSLTSTNFRPDVETIDETSYRRLEELGFRRRPTYSPGGSIVRSFHKKSPLMSPMKSFSSGAMRKLSNTIVEQPHKQIPNKKEDFQTHPMEMARRNRTRKPAKLKSLLDEVKECVNWDKRVAPPTYILEDQVKYMPATACFSMRDSACYSHYEVKDLVEQQTNCQVKSIQYDAVSVRMPEFGTLDRWIVTFTSEHGCAMAIQQGLIVDDDKIVVRTLADVKKEEYANYKWNYPESYRLIKERNNLLLKNFLSTNGVVNRIISNSSLY